MEEALRARLRAGAEIAARVAGRVNWGGRIQGDPLPGIALTRIPSRRHHTYQGASDLQFTRVQMDCWAASQGEAVLIGRAVTALLERPAIEAGIRFAPAFLAGGQDGPAERDPAGQLVHRTRLDFIIWHALM